MDSKQAELSYQKGLSEIDLLLKLEFFEASAKGGHQGAWEQIKKLFHVKEYTVEKFELLYPLNAQWFEFANEFDERSVMRRQFLLRAAHVQYPKAMKQLGECYSGKKSEMWYRLAFEEYQELARNGDTEAQYVMGSFYHSGHGIEKNGEKANEFFQQAANQGHMEAQYKIGRALYYGYGILQDTQKALSFLFLSANQGYSHAKDLLTVTSREEIPIFRGNIQQLQRK